MVTFGGTTQKCKACEKTVYLVDQLASNATTASLKLGNSSSFEGVLYCRPHFDQLFKMTGSLDKSFEGTPKTLRSTEPVQVNNRVSSLFAGTTDKCVVCKKTVYPIEKVAADGSPYHRGCFKCCHGDCVINTSNYIAHEHRLYGKHHHSQLFKERGNFIQLRGVKEKESD